MSVIEAVRKLLVRGKNTSIKTNNVNEVEVKISETKDVLSNLINVCNDVKRKLDYSDNIDDAKKKLGYLDKSQITDNINSFKLELDLLFNGLCKYNSQNQTSIPMLNEKDVDETIELIKFIIRFLDSIRSVKNMENKDFEDYCEEYKRHISILEGHTQDVKGFLDNYKSILVWRDK